MSRVDDLAGMLVPPEGEDTSVVQGTIRAFDPDDSFENVIEVDGVNRRNVPVGSGLEALTYAPGDVVLIRQWFPGGRRGERGLATSWIEGRVITPGTGAAQRTIAFMRGALAKQIAHEIFAEQVHAAENPASGGTSSLSYTEVLAGGNGPILTGVQVSEVGLAIVGVQAQISIIADPAQTNTAFMSYRVTGATIRAALDVNAKRTDIGDTDAAHITNVTDQSMSWSLQSGLNPGLHTFETMYRANYAAAYAQRRIIVIAL